MTGKSMMKIGEVAKKANVTPRTIRFYIQENLLPQPVKTRKNMAYYGEDIVEKIIAIKKAQTERFLPLVVIRRILEQNQFDYAALDGPPEVLDPTNKKTDETETQALNEDWNIPKDVLAKMVKRKWVTTIAKDGIAQYAPADLKLLNLLAQLNQAGVSWEDMLNSLQSIQRTFKKVIELEFQTYIRWLMKHPTENFYKTYELEKLVLKNFIDQTRKDYLKKITLRYKQNKDHAFFASSDEGFAIPAGEISEELRLIEENLSPHTVDVRRLNDLAIGYSCCGNLDKAALLLNRILRKESDNLEARVRWIWYSRFKKRERDIDQLKQQLIHLVETHPDYAFARAFLAFWNFFNIFDQNDHREMLHVMNRCLIQLERADQGFIQDINEWAVIQYIKGKILTSIPSLTEYLEEGVRVLEKILERKKELDQLWMARMPFFPKWWWPNCYFTLGNAYLRSKRYTEALETFQKGSGYNLMSPFKDRLEEGIQAAKRQKTPSLRVNR